MNDELKPCPFCGAEMQVREHSAFHPPRPECWLSTAGEFAGVYELDESDYASWNRRPSSIDIEGIAREIVTEYQSGSGTELQPLIRAILRRSLTDTIDKLE